MEKTVDLVDCPIMSREFFYLSVRDVFDLHLDDRSRVDHHINLQNWVIQPTYTYSPKHFCSNCSLWTTTSTAWFVCRNLCLKSLLLILSDDSPPKLHLFGFIQQFSTQSDPTLLPCLFSWWGGICAISGRLGVQSRSWRWQITVCWTVIHKT